MKGFITNIEKDTLENEFYRKVLYTSKNCQLVLMCLNPGEEIGEEVHDLDQFIRIEEGDGVVVLNGVESRVGGDFAIVIPEGVSHNVINKGDRKMKLYSLYSPQEHKDKTIHKTKEEAELNHEHFDGVLSE